METLYIQRREGASLETVDELNADEFETLAAMRREARRLVAEYKLSDDAGAYYVSRRPCKAWSA